MNTKTIELGGTNIVATEENGVVTIQIQSTDAVVFMNKDMIWSIGNEKEEFKYVPQIFHGFLLKSDLEHIEYDGKGKKTMADVTVEGASVGFYFPVNKTLHIHARFDFIESVEYVKDCLLEQCDEVEITPYVAELDKRVRELESLVASFGYRIALSHSKESWAYAWWDIIFTQADWTEENITRIMQEVNKINAYVDLIQTELGLED